MIQAKLCFVAEGVTMDHETREVSALRIQESLDAEAFPAPAPRMAFYCLLDREDSDASTHPADFTISVDGVELLRATINLEFLGFSRSRTVLRIDGLVIPKPGNLLFRLSLPNGATAEYVIRAQLAKPPVAETRPIAAGSTSNTGPAATAYHIASGAIRIR